MLCGAHAYECGYKHTNLSEDAGGSTGPHQVLLSVVQHLFPPQTGSPTEHGGL